MSIYTNNSITELNGVRIQCFGGYCSQSGAIQHGISFSNPNAFRVIAQYSHHSVTSYGCSFDAMYGYYAGHGGLQSTHTFHQVSSANGGTWSVTRSGTGTTYVQKSAGSYVGSGYYSIFVISGCSSF